MRRGERKRRRRQGGWACWTRTDVLQASVSPLHLDLFPPEASVESQTTQQMAPGSWALPPAGLSLGLESYAVLTEETSVAGPGQCSWGDVREIPSNPEVSAQSHPSIPAPPLCPNFASSNFAPKLSPKTLLSKGTSDAQASSPFSVIIFPCPAPLQATFTCFGRSKPSPSSSRKHSLRHLDLLPGDLFR